MRSYLRPSVLPALLIISSAAVFADTVTLKSGDKVQGKITSETATEIIMEEKVSASITDNRAIKKSDVAKVDKDAPDDVAWQSVRNIKLGSNSMQVPAYDVSIATLKTFVRDFPQSSHIAEAQKVLADFEDEKKRVAAGDVKLNNSWITKEIFEKERYQISAQIAFNSMKEQAAKNDWITALNLFDNLEKQFPGARVFPDAVELARTTIGRLQAVTVRLTQKQAQDKAEAEKTLEASAEPQKTELTNALQREQSSGEAAVTAALAQGMKWPPLIQRSEKSVTALTELSGTEVQRLNEINTANLRESIKLAEEAKTALAADKIEPAEEALTKAKSLWDANELATRLEPELAAAKTKLAKAEQPAADTVPVDATPEPAVAESTETTHEAPAPQGDEEKPFYLRPVGAIVIVIGVIAVIALFSAFRKIKSRANDVLE